MAYPERPPVKRPEYPSLAAVLVIFTSDQELLFTVRSQAVETHRGQIAFPGGAHHTDDSNLEVTALRETREEIGLTPDLFEVIGVLPELWTISDFWVTPVVAVTQLSRADLEGRLHLEVSEVDQVFFASLQYLLYPATYTREWITRGAIRFPTHVYQVGPHRVWGATGAMVKNLLDRWVALG